MRIDLTAAQVKAVTTMLADELGDETDDRLLLDSLEAETDLFEIVAKLIEKIEDEEYSAKVLGNQIDIRKERATRSKKRMESYRAAVAGLMTLAGIKKLPLPEASVTLTELDDRLVPQSGAVPDEFMKDGPRQIDNAAIRAKFEASTDPLPNWLTRETDRRSIQIRRK